MLNVQKTIHWLLSVVGRATSDGRQQRRAVVLQYLKCLGRDQVVTATYLYKSVQKSHSSLFRNVGFSKFEAELFELKTAHQITNNQFGYWRISPQDPSKIPRFG